VKNTNKNETYEEVERKIAELLTSDDRKKNRNLQEEFDRWIQKLKDFGIISIDNRFLYSLTTEKVSLPKSNFRNLQANLRVLSSTPEDMQFEELIPQFNELSEKEKIKRALKKKYVKTIFKTKLSVRQKARRLLKNSKVLKVIYDSDAFLNRRYVIL
jgi:hypothetical protein